MTIIEELEQIRSEHGGILYPTDVVEYAQDPGTELHRRFEWDDTKAAHQHRLWQARHIINVHVTVLKKDDIRIDTYVSLRADRNDSGERGYRSVIEVMSSDDLRATLLEEALLDFERWEEKYKSLQELAGIFAAAKTLRQRRDLVPIPA